MGYLFCLEAVLTVHVVVPGFKSTSYGLGLDEEFTVYGLGLDPDSTGYSLGLESVLTGNPLAMVLV